MPKRRPSGDGAVRKRADRRREGSIVTGYDDNNLPQTESVLVKTKNECIKKLNTLKTECEDSIGKLPKRAKPEMTCGEWLELWYNTYSKSALRITTQNCYEQRIY